MKRIVVYMAFSLLPFSLFSQINWLHDMTSAQAMSIAQSKLIVMDFTASWCQPCKTMDTRLWTSDEMKELSKNFIFLRVDIDVNSSLASDYGINSIPCVIITNIVGDDLWRLLGYKGTNKEYLDIFKQAPGNISNLNLNLLPLLRKEETTKDLFELGKAYQDLGKNQSKGMLKISFLDLSNNYFKKVQKKGDEQSKEAELRSLLNLVYAGKPDKALSKLEKYPENYFPEELTDLLNQTKELCLAN